MTLVHDAKQVALKIRGADDSFHTPMALLEHGYEQARFGLPEDGLADMQAAIVMYRSHRPGANYLATMLVDAATALTEMGRFAEAHQNLDEANAIKTKNGLDTHAPIHNFNTSTRVRLALAEDQIETARSLVDDLFVDPDETLGISFTATEQWLLAAEIDLASGNSASATELTRRVRGKIAASRLDEYLAFYAMRADLIEGRAKLQEHDADVALPLLQRTLSMREQLLAPASLRIAEAQIALAECDLALGRKAEARSLADAAMAKQAQHPQIGEQYRAPLLRLKGLLAAVAEK
jgi:tetratricopeptide (TPR) repeat protein